MGAERLRKIQMGVESTAGTAVASTYIWRGKGMLFDEDDIQAIDENIGHHLPSDRSGKVALAAMCRFDPIAMTPEGLPHILSSALENIVTGTADGSASSGYTYEYAWTDVRTANAIKYRTLEMVTAQQTKEMEYSYVEEFTLSGDANGFHTMEAVWRGRQATNVTKTALTTITDVNNLAFGANTLYIDDGGGTIGSTDVSSSVLSYKLNVKTGWVPVYTFDDLYFTTVEYVGASATLDLTYRYNGTGVAEETARKNETVRLMRMDITGEAYGTAGSGTLFSGVKGVRIDIAGKYLAPVSIEEKDGYDIVRSTLTMGHNTTDDVMLAITVANELSALP